MNGRTRRMKRSQPKLWRLQTARLGGSAEPAVMNGIRLSLRSGGSKCPCCSGYTFIKGKNDLKNTHPQIAEEWSEKNFPLKPK